MKPELLLCEEQNQQAALVTVFAVDQSTAKAPDAKPAPKLLTSEVAIQKAAEAVLTSGEFKAGASETLLLHAPQGLKATRLLLVGLGKDSKASFHDVRKGTGTAVRFAKPRGIRSITVLLPSTFDPRQTARAAVEGAYVGDFDPDTYRSDRKDQSIQQLTVIASSTDKAQVEAGYNEGVIFGESQNFTRALVNEPGNKLTPTILGERAAAMAKEQGLKCEVYSTEKIKELKMGSFWSVAQGSDEPPALIVIT